MTAEQRAAVEMFSSQMVNKILHYPILQLKDASVDEPQERESLRKTIRKIFGLRS
jgi:glutamyl-tRNA reductase